jgi:exopolysaccharide biosynthesis operon protein EpsL
MLLLGLLSSKVFAVSSQDDTIKPYVASTLQYESNFLRAPDNANSSSLGGKSDKSEFIKQAAAGFDMDWAVSRQHFIIRANLNQNWFQNFDSLDYLGWKTLAQWNWQLGSNLNGEIGYANAQEMGGFEYTNRIQNNLLNLQRSFANVAYLFHPNGKVKLDLFRSEFQYANKSNGLQLSHNIEDNVALNLEYLSDTRSTAGLQIIATDGQYPERQFTIGSIDDNAYTRMKYAGIWSWIISDKASIDGLFGYTHQQYAHVSGRNFAEFIGSVNTGWRITEKILLKLSIRREVDSYAAQTFSFLVKEGAWFDPTWQFSPKFSITLPMTYQQQQFLGNVSNIDFSQQRKDIVSNIGVNLKYSPLDNISTGTVLSYESRDSNISSRSYKSFSAGINLMVNF